MKFRPLICLCAALLAPVPAFAAKSETKTERFTVTRDGDFEMSCEQLWNEAYAMRGIIASTQLDRNESIMQKRGIGVVGTAASYLVGTVTGGLSIAAAGFAASQATENREQDAEQIQDVAHQRRALMIGIFGSKNCKGDISAALVDHKPLDPLEELAKMETAAGTPTGKGGRDIDGDEDGENRTAGEILSRKRAANANQKFGPYAPMKSKGYNQ